MTSQDKPEQDRCATSQQGEQNILVVKLGAFGNIILSLAAFAAIRRHHAGARISVLTSAPYADWLRHASHTSIDVLVDPRPAWWDFAGLRRLRQDAGGRALQPGLRSADLGTVVPLLPSVPREAPAGMVGHRLRLLAAGPRSAAQCAARHRPPAGSVAPGRDQRVSAGRPVLVPRRHRALRSCPPISRCWCPAARRTGWRSGGRPRRYQALAARAWPSAASRRSLSGARPRAGTGGGRSRPAIDLIGQTSFGDLADLARAARFAVGNDTGPMHLIATAGCAAITLFSNDSNPVAMRARAAAGRGSCSGPTSPTCRSRPCWKACLTDAPEHLDPRQTTSGQPSPDGVPMPQRMWAILTIGLGLTLAVLDGGIANVALPTIAREVQHLAGEFDLGGERLSARGDDLPAAAVVAGGDLRLPADLPGRAGAVHRSPRWPARCRRRCRR